MTKEEVCKALIETLNNENFKPAFENAQAKYLERKHAYVLFCGRHKIYIGLKLYACLKQALKG